MSNIEWFDEVGAIDRKPWLVIKKHILFRRTKKFSIYLFEQAEAILPKFNNRFETAGDARAKAEELVSDWLDLVHKEKGDRFVICDNCNNKVDI